MSELVRVRHPEVGEAVVPRSALRQMADEWQLVDDDQATEVAAPTTKDEDE